MKRILLLSAISMGLLSSCSTAFKAGQTPDDVYFSPGREVASSDREERVQKEDEAQYQEYISSLDDRYLRMKVANRSRWSTIDNFDYWYDSRYDFNSYSYDYNGYGYNTWNPNWNRSIGYGYRSYYPGYGYGGIGWSSPVYTVIGYTNPKFVGGGYTSGSNITAYKNRTYNNNNYGYKDPKTGAFVPGSNGSSFGNLLKRVFSSSETTQSYDRPARTFDQPANNASRTPTTPTPPPATSSNAGGSSGGYGSTGSSTSTGRGGRGN
ncbi:MAG: hypothetical protein ABI581_13865 [Sediminibacterium sp.]